MKEQYLSRESFDQTISDMVNELNDHHYRPKPWKLNPEKAALLVLDMQNYFLDPASHAYTPSAPAIVPNILKLIDFAKKFDMEIIYTKHINNEQNAGMMAHWWRDLINEGSWESEIIKTVSKESPARDDSLVGMDTSKIILKNQYDAFYNTDLEEYLRSKNIEQVIIAGVLTNLCCETTARSAFVRGFEVFFPVDATAAYNKEFHLGTFRNLGFGFCPIITTEDLINSLHENV